MNGATTSSAAEIRCGRKAGEGIDWVTIVFWLGASSWHLSLHGFGAWLANLLDKDGGEG
jgi:hypothetical protein